MVRNKTVLKKVGQQIIIKKDKLDGTYLKTELCYWQCYRIADKGKKEEEKTKDNKYRQMNIG